MDFTDFKSVLCSMANATNDIGLDSCRFFVHSITDNEYLQLVDNPRSDAGYDFMYSVCLFVFVNDRWVFLTNVNCGPRSSLVNLYCSSDLSLSSSILNSLKPMVNHYFIQRQVLRVYNPIISSAYDRFDSISAILSCYFC